MEPVLGYRITEYETIENRSRNWTENQMGNQIEDVIVKIKSKIKSKIKLKIKWNLKLQANWKLYFTVDIARSIIFHILNQNSDFWHKMSSIEKGIEGDINLYWAIPFNSCTPPMDEEEGRFDP